MNAPFTADPQCDVIVSVTNGAWWSTVNNWIIQWGWWRLSSLPQIMQCLRHITTQQQQQQQHYVYTVQYIAKKALVYVLYKWYTVCTVTQENFNGENFCLKFFDILYFHCSTDVM